MDIIKLLPASTSTLVETEKTTVDTDNGEDADIVNGEGDVTVDMLGSPESQAAQ